MDWRVLISDRLLASPDVAEALADGRDINVPDHIFGAGSLTGHPGVAPFLLLAFGPDVPRAAGGAREGECVVWCHDDPGGYLRIGRVLAAVRMALLPSVTDPGAVAVEWQGSSGDLADDRLDTITRNHSYRLMEKELA